MANDEDNDQQYLGKPWHTLYHWCGMGTCNEYYSVEIVG